MTYTVKDELGNDAEFNGGLSAWDSGTPDGSNETTALDSSSNKNYGYVFGAIRSTDIPAVLTGKSLSLDGTNDYVNVPNGATSVSGASAATISLWFKADDTVGQRGLINFGTTSKVSLYIRIGELFIWDSVAARALTFSDTTSWHHLTVVFDGLLAAADRWKFYLDGVYVAFTYSSGVPIPATLPSMSGEPIQIGQIAALTYYFDGHLDDVRIFNVAKTAVQAAALAAGTDDQTGIVGQWKFDETIRDLPALAGGRSLEFNGTSDYAIAANSIGLSGDITCTLTAWIKVNTLVDSSTPLMFGRWGIAGGGIGLVYHSDGSFGVNFGSGNAITSAAGLINVDIWYHLAIVKTPGAINTTTKIYLNGVKIPIGFSTGITPNILTDAPVIGAYRNASGVIVPILDGFLDDIRVYSIALTDLQIVSLYEGTDELTGLIAHWKLDDELLTNKVSSIFSVFDENGNEEENVNIYSRMLIPPSNIGGYDSKIATWTSDINGEVQITGLFVGAVYQFWREGGNRIRFEVPEGDVNNRVELPPLLGDDETDDC